MCPQRPYFNGVRQTRNQYENAIKLSMNTSENQFNALDSTCWSEIPVQVCPPQDSQYRSSSFMILRHSQHCFDISQIVSDAPAANYPPNQRKVLVPGALSAYRTADDATAH
jgi:hypothetical protein